MLVVILHTMLKEHTGVNKLHCNIIVQLLLQENCVHVYIYILKIPLAYNVHVKAERNAICIKSTKCKIFNNEIIAACIDGPISI